MQPWIELDTATVPGDGAPLRLKRRGDEFSIMAGATELMNSRLHGSEEALARLSCEKIRTRKRPKVLIGGLGMGFTLRAALTETGDDAEITVAELVPAVVDWAYGPLAPMLIGGLGMGFTLRAALAETGDDAEITVAELVPAVVDWAYGPLAPVFAGSLDDPRVLVLEGDVSDAIAAGGWDAILLDVDNGPDGLTREENDSLYGYDGLAAAHRALTPGGVLAVWSSHRSPGFARRLRASGYAVEEIAARARGKRGARHVIWIAVKPG
jgi:spermidine synthase